MKIKHYIFSCLLFLGTIAISQTYFNNRYNVGGEDALNIAQNIIFNDIDKIIAGEFINISDSHRKIGLVRILNDGTMDSASFFFSDEYSYGLSGFSDSFKRLSSSSFIAVGNRIKYYENTPYEGNIYIFDTNLDTVVIKSTSDLDTSILFRHFSFANNNSFIITGDIYPVSGGFSNVLLMKTDSLGNEIWRRYYNSGAFNMGTNVLSLPDGGYALSCHKWVFQSTVSHNYLIRTDSLGNELWRRYIGGDLDDGPLFLAWSDVDSTIVGAYHTADSAITNADSYNRLALIKVDVDNNLIYDNKYMPEKDYDQYNFQVNGITIDSMNNIIVVGTTLEPWPASAGYLFKFTNDGDSLWYRQYQKIYSLYADNNLYGVTPTPDGGYAAVGSVLPYPPDTGNQDVWVIKVDSMGCIAQNDCWVGNKEIMALQSKESLKIYPNPASNRIKILIPKENENEEYVLTIWDLFGRKLEEVIVTSGQTEVELDISEYSTGLFNVIATKDGKNAGNGKFIKR